MSLDIVIDDVRDYVNVVVTQDCIDYRWFQLYLALFLSPRDILGQNPLPLPKAVPEASPIKHSHQWIQVEGLFIKSEGKGKQTWKQGALDQRN